MNNLPRKPKPNMEEILNYVSSRFITLDKGRKRSANPQLSKVIYRVVREMKIVSRLFKVLFKTFLYAGSSYDGLKIGKPDEFDIDLKLFLPKKLNVQIIQSDQAGFVHVRLKGWDKLKKDTNLYSIYKDLENFMDDDHFLSQVKIKQWMESIVTQAINRIENTKAFSKLNVSYKISGPAVTLIIPEYKMTIDLVAVFHIPGSKWPGPPVRENMSIDKHDYLVVPKPPKTLHLKQNLERYWRLSFPEQELEFMYGYYFCKPALRLIKKLRDTHSHNIPSYFIKTVFLWEIEDRNNDNDSRFWESSKTNVFLEMLKIYKRYIESGDLPYFWDEDNNFLLPYSENNLANISGYLEDMIENIKSSMYTNPIVVAEYLLPADEYEKVLRKYNMN